jgi:hypothetical protein
MTTQTREQPNTPESGAFQRGDLVICKCAGGKVRQNVVWAVEGCYVAVCSEQTYPLLLADVPGTPQPIRFPASDVSKATA